MTENGPQGWEQPPGQQGQWGQQPPPGQWGGQPPAQWGQQPPAGYYAAPTTSSKAIIALVLAIASFVVCPVVPAIVALVMVPQARDEIAASGGRVGGDGLVTAAKIIAWVHLGLTIATLVIVFGVLILGGVASTSA